MPCVPPVSLAPSVWRNGIIPPCCCKLTKQATGGIFCEPRQFVDGKLDADWQSYNCAANMLKIRDGDDGLVSRRRMRLSGATGLSPNFRPFNRGVYQKGTRMADQRPHSRGAGGFHLPPLHSPIRPADAVVPRKTHEPQPTSTGERSTRRTHAKKSI